MPFRTFLPGSRSEAGGPSSLAGLAPGNQARGREEEEKEGKRWDLSRLGLMKEGGGKDLLGCWLWLASAMGSVRRPSFTLSPGDRQTDERTT